ncbi:MAG: hypothetical protein AABX07_01795 [Nanoarchaeota archaeon]
MDISETEKFLIQNVREYYETGKEAQDKGNYNSAITMYFKTIAILCDLYIYKKTGRIPSNHAERFRILEKFDKEIYDLIDRNFSFYQDSYRSRLTAEICLLIYNDVKRLYEKVGVDI